MSEQQNVETMKRFYEAFTSGNIPAMLKLVTDDFVLSNDFTVKVADGRQVSRQAGARTVL